MSNDKSNNPSNTPIKWTPIDTPPPPIDEGLSGDNCPQQFPKDPIETVAGNNFNTDELIKRARHKAKGRDEITKDGPKKHGLSVDGDPEPHIVGS